MGSNTNRFMIMVTLSSLVFSIVQGSDSYNPDSLEAFVHDYANKAIRKPRTGTLYNVPLPANFSGMEASFVRLRSGSFWVRGANFSSFHIPPRVIPMPFAKRIVLVYQNLGNWSSSYYNVPNHSLVGPVVGFMAYDAPDLGVIGTQKLKFSIMGDPVMVRFPPILLEDKNATLKCVKFGAGGSVEFSNMTKLNVCITQGPGHFAIVKTSPSQKKQKQKERVWKWWVIGFGVGFVVLVLFCLVVVVIVKAVRRKKIQAMERQSEKGVVFDSTWIEGSKMPSASMIRTQPVIENEYVA